MSNSNDSSVFLSHNVADKPIVEPIALKLLEVFNQEVIFYDSWSIQPGDSILEKMEEGLKSCKFFFLFISKNSLKSKMVELEWRAALNKLTSVNNEMKLIAIRLDDTEMPLLLKDLLWIDAFNQGFESLVRNMYDIIMGNKVFHPKFKTLRNLKATLNIIDENNAKVIVEALHFAELNSEIAVWWKNEENLEISLIGGNIAFHSAAMGPVENESEVGPRIVSVKGTSSLYPGNPVKIKIKAKFNLYENRILIFHKENNTKLKLIETELIGDLYKIKFLNQVLKTADVLFLKEKEEE